MNDNFLKKTKVFHIKKYKKMWLQRTFSQDFSFFVFFLLFGTFLSQCLKYNVLPREPPVAMSVIDCAGSCGDVFGP